MENITPIPQEDGDYAYLWHATTLRAQHLSSRPMPSINMVADYTSWLSFFCLISRRPACRMERPHFPATVSEG